MTVTSQSISVARIVVDDRPLPYEPGDTVADAIIRAGQHPQHGGTLCLAGDCGNCSAVVAGVGFTRTCQTAAAPGLDVRRHPLVGGPPLRNAVLADPDVRERLNNLGIAATPGTPERFGEDIRRDLNRYGPVVKAAGIKAE